MVYEMKEWVNVPNPSEFTPEQLDSFPRFDALNMNRIEFGVNKAVSHSVNKNNPHDVTVEQIGAMSKTEAIDGQDILNLKKEGFYYSTRTINVPTSEVAGYIRIQVATSENYRVIYWRPYNSTIEYMNVLKGGTWLGWVEMFTSQGGTLTGHLVFENLKSFHALKKGRTIGDVVHDVTVGVSSDGSSTMEHYTGGVVDGRLELTNVDGNYAALRVRGNSSGVSYRVFGEHNKPVGSYIGNGGKSKRTITINGICNNLLIWGDNNLGIITATGGIVKTNNASALSISPSSYIVSNGSLVINLSNSEYNYLFNSDGITYYYQVL